MERAAEMDIKISVIVPVYNTGEYLRPCLDSIQKQTFIDFEVLCIDDGSTDNSPEILKEYCHKDSRFKYLKKENGGLSSARNYGLEKAKGMYIYYCDSDDEIESETFSILFEKMESNSLDILYFGAKTVYESLDLKKNNKSAKDNYVRTHIYSDIYTGIDLLGLLYKNNEYIVSACLQIIHKDFLNKCGVKFEDKLLYEDNVYTFKTLLFAERVGVINKEFYIRRIRKGSITTSHSKFENFYGYLKGARYMIEYINSRTWDFKIEELARKIIQYSMINRAIFVMRSLPYEEQSKINKMELSDSNFYNYLIKRPFLLNIRLDILILIINQI